MSTFAIVVLVLVIGAIATFIAMKTGKVADANGNNIPDAVEEKLEAVKEVVQAVKNVVVEKPKPQVEVEFLSQATEGEKKAIKEALQPIPEIVAEVKRTPVQKPKQYKPKKEEPKKQKQNVQVHPKANVNKKGKQKSK